MCRLPFQVISRPTRTTVEIKVGENKDRSNRTEIRHFGDVKQAYLRDDAVEAERPKRGRPPKAPDSPDAISNASPSKNSLPLDTTIGQNVGSPNNNRTPNLENSNSGGNTTRTVRSTRNPMPNYIASLDFSKPPPFMAPNSNFPPTPAEHTGPPPFSGFLRREPWSASIMELNAINQSIAGSPVRCEARG